MVDGEDDISEIEDYAIAEVVNMTEVAGCAGELDDMDERIVEDGTKTEAETMTLSPDVNVLVIVEPTPGGDNVRMVVTALLADAGSLGVFEGR